MVCPGLLDLGKCVRVTTADPTNQRFVSQMQLFSQGSYQKLGFVFSPITDVARCVMVWPCTAADSAENGRSVAPLSSSFIISSEICSWKSVEGFKMDLKNSH